MGQVASPAGVPPIGGGASGAAVSPYVSVRVRSASGGGAAGGQGEYTAVLGSVLKSSASAQVNGSASSKSSVSNGSHGNYGQLSKTVSSRSSAGANPYESVKSPLGGPISAGSRSKRFGKFQSGFETREPDMMPRSVSAYRQPQKVLTPFQIESLTAMVGSTENGRVPRDAIAYYPFTTDGSDRFGRSTLQRADPRWPGTGQACRSSGTTSNG